MDLDELLKETHKTCGGEMGQIIACAKLIAKILSQQPQENLTIDVEDISINSTNEHLGSIKIEYKR